MMEACQDGMSLNDLYEQLSQLENNSDNEVSSDEELSSNEESSDNHLTKLNSVSTQEVEEPPVINSNDDNSWTTVTSKRFSDITRANVPQVEVEVTASQQQIEVVKHYQSKQVIDGIKYEFMLNPKILKYIKEKFNISPTIDLFANKNSTQCKKFYHFDKSNKDEHFDAFKHYWGNEDESQEKKIVFINYPFNYLDKGIISKIRSEEAEVLMLIHTGKVYSYTQQLEGLYDWSYDLPITDDLFLIATDEGLFQPEPPHLPPNPKYSIIHIPGKNKYVTLNELPTMESFPALGSKSLNSKVVFKQEQISKEKKSSGKPSKINFTKVVKQTKLQSSVSSHLPVELSETILNSLKEDVNICDEVTMYLSTSEKIKSLEKQIELLQLKSNSYKKMIVEYNTMR